MANGAAAVARLDNWFWTSSPPARDVLSGEIFDDPPPRSWPDGAYTTTSNVSELEQRGAAEGKISSFTRSTTRTWHLHGKGAGLCPRPCLTGQRHLHLLLP